MHLLAPHWWNRLSTKYMPGLISDDSSAVIALLAQVTRRRPSFRGRLQRDPGLLPSVLQLKTADRKPAAGDEMEREG